MSPTLSDFDTGYLIGLLVGEGHFGGDGRQPHVTLRMHTDHEAVFTWLMDRFPESRLYGPYNHSGRKYYQWMARGHFLRDQLLPLLDQHLAPHHSERVYDRFLAMKERYGRFLRTAAAGQARLDAEESDPGTPPAAPGP